MTDIYLQDNLTRHGYQITEFNYLPYEAREIIEFNNMHEDIQDCIYSVPVATIKIQSNTTPTCILCGTEALLICDMCSENIKEYAQLARKIKENL